MKKVVVVATLVMVGMAVQADFFINFKSSFGIYDATGSTGILPNMGDQGLVQLIYAGADGLVDYSSGTDLSVGDTDLLAGDDQLLFSTIFENTGGLYEDFASATFDGTFQAVYAAPGNIYARIFTGTGQVGDTYYQGHLFAAGDLSPGLDSPETYDLGQGAAGQAANFGSVIPEPATIGLMGFAGMGMFLARKKARR